MDTKRKVESSLFLSVMTNKLESILYKAPQPGPEVIQLLSCSSQLSMKFIMLINVKKTTIVGNLTFISIINTASESLKARKVLILVL